MINSFIRPYTGEIFDDLSQDDESDEETDDSEDEEISRAAKRRKLVHMSNMLQNGFRREARVLPSAQRPSPILEEDEDELDTLISTPSQPFEVSTPDARAGIKPSSSPAF